MGEKYLASELLYMNTILLVLSIFFQKSLNNTEGPQIVQILCPQGIVLLQKLQYSGTDLVLKLQFMTFGFPKSPFSHISGLHLMKNYGFFLLSIPHLNNQTMVDQFLSESFRKRLSFDNKRLSKIKTFVKHMKLEIFFTKLGQNPQNLGEFGKNRTIYDLGIRTFQYYFKSY